MTFDATVVAAVTAHMNDDHAEDNLLIARAFGAPGATAATMTSVDAEGGTWTAASPDGEHALTVAWPGGPVFERAQIRRAVVLVYRAACERLGVSPREEHGAPPAHHGEPHAPAQVRPHAEDTPGFARRLREATWSDHGDSEGATFMADIMRGRGTRADYADLVAQHWFMYDALEPAAEHLHADPALSTLHPQALQRQATLEHDLEHLFGPEWRDQIVALPATAAYAQRIREVATEGWLAGIVAHHYTRYLGDLSGGQLIARRMVAQFGFTDAGVAFYDFGALGDAAEFKNGYRGVLDSWGATLAEAEQQRMLDEVRAAYRFNTEVFQDLGEARAAA